MYLKTIITPSLQKYIKLCIIEKWLKYYYWKQILCHQFQYKLLYWKITPSLTWLASFCNKYNKQDFFVTLTCLLIQKTYWFRKSYSFKFCSAKNVISCTVNQNINPSLSYTLKHWYQLNGCGHDVPPWGGRRCKGLA